MFPPSEGQSWCLSPRNGATFVIVSALVALCIRCPNALPMLSQYITLAVTVPTGIIVECLSAFWRQIGFKLHRARLEPHEDSFQDACVNHNRLDADDESVTRMHTPHSKSLAGGNDDDYHVHCNCVPSPAIVGYMAFYCQSALSMFPTPIAIPYTSSAIATLDSD